MSPLPTNTENTFRLLQEKITWLHASWRIYKQLFDSSDQERIDILEDCAGSFFYLVENSILDKVLLTICKLTDPTSNGKDINLSLSYLLKLLQDNEDINAREYKRLLNKIKRDSESIRERRNKQLSHSDLKVESKINSLSPLHINELEDVLKQIRELMNLIETNYNNYETGYEHTSMRGDGDDLIAILKYAMKYEKMLEDETVTIDEDIKDAWDDA
ncbi:MAG: hypothetical protein P9L94_01045 [Candidatus Hinthialibacter antarcticus]|nr:hypothetical protein [Candidatus Hinthialibacter antarcticus]